MNQDHQTSDQAPGAHSLEQSSPAPAHDPTMAALEAGIADATPSVEALTAELASVKAKSEENWDLLLRARAELENARRRHAAELEKAHKFALDAFVRELLQVRDSLELGESAAREPGADIGKLREGMGLTAKLLADVMEKFGVAAIDPLGQPFDPEFHQAMSMQARADVPPNQVVSVMQKGYSLNGRLMRPALVLVSRAAEP